MLRRSSTLLCAAAFAAAAFLQPAGAAKPAAGPGVVKVQHILVGFKRSLPKKALERTKKEAEELATSLLSRAREGEDFDALVKEFTDDAYPGIYPMTSNDAPVRSGAVKREQMVPAFGDVAFGLEVGEIGIAAYSVRDSPYGWHIIKRLE